MADIKKETIPDKSITVFRITGKIDVEQIINELDWFYEDEFTDSMLWDFSEAYIKDLTGNDLQMIASHAKELGQMRKNKKTAFVIASSLGYGLGRMYDSLAQVIEHPVKHSVFRSYDEAVAWLGDVNTD